MRRLRPQLNQRKKTAQALNTSPYGLLVPLNNESKTERTQDLLALLRTLQEIERLEDIAAEVDGQLSQDPNYVGAGHRAPSRLYVQANTILSACNWSPRVAPPPNELHSFTWEARTTQSDCEKKFVYWILNLRATGDISRIRSCRNCRQWFYAVTNHQIHCGDRCRQQFLSRDKGFKEKRRLYMRQHRKREKLRNAAAKQLLGRRTRRGASE
jgi:hypothetical protein